MELLVLRHGKAEEVGSGGDDDSRNLTLEGRDELILVGRALRKIAPEIDLIATSPLARAVETADIIADQYQRGASTAIPRAINALLRPETSAHELLDWLNEQRNIRRIMIVGHQPQLGEAISYFLTGGGRPFLDVKKASATLLSFSRIYPGGAELCWSFSPRQLEKLIA